MLDSNYSEAEDTQRNKYLSFSLGEEEYGIYIGYVTEIIRIQPVTEIPELPEYMKGVINLRGKIIPVMDVRLRFKKPPKEYNERTCIIIVEMKGISVGLIVYHVSEVLTIPGENIAAPPEFGKGVNNKYIKGIGRAGDDVKLILDCNELLHDEETENLRKLEDMEEVRV